MTVTAQKATRPPQLYVGQQASDFKPEWDGLHGDGVALAEGCWKAVIGDHLPWLVLADWLDERDDPRGQWVRQFVHWDQVAQAGEFGSGEVIDWGNRQASFAEHTKTESGWRWVGLWNAIAARWCPDGYGVGPQWETWADERVRAVNVWCVLWSCRLAAGGQAYEAWRQASAAGRQASAAGRQASAAWWQAYAAGRQAYAAGSQASAAVSQAYAAENKCREWMMRLWSVMSKAVPVE